MTQTSPTPTIDETVIPDPDVHRAERRKLAMLAGILTGGIVLSLLTGSFPVVAFMLAMVVTVMLHETGHFVMAKRSGMKVTEFFVGFGPRLWSVRKGETEYGIKAIPVGGYVKILGMSNLERDIDPADEPRTFRQQSYPKRMAVLLAGIVTHFVIAFVLLVALWSAIGVPNYENPEIGSLSRLEDGTSPAQAAGFRVGDRVVAVGGTPVARWQDVPPHILDRAGQPVTFEVERGGQRLELTATPVEVGRNGETRGVVGINPKATTERVNPLAASGRAVSEIGQMSVGSIQAIGSFFTPSSLRGYANQLTDNGPTTSASPDDPRFISVVGVGRLAGQAAENGVRDIVYLMVLLNICLGVLNLFPLLPLDGGHVAIASYERVRSRAGRRYQADVAKMVPFAAAVIAVLVIIGVTSIYLDIVHPMPNPFQ